jgi:hypothetical protein
MGAIPSIRSGTEGSTGPESSLYLNGKKPSVFFAEGFKSCVRMNEDV